MEGVEKASAYPVFLGRIKKNFSRLASEQWGEGGLDGDKDNLGANPVPGGSPWFGGNEKMEDIGIEPMTSTLPALRSPKLS